ncbi:amino acid permease [Dysgonomonas sp. BGC7]|uniref:amino acid permease n=1 Tax=Dysgonomonas sp. BGC7 TaxID=1658008 RepID=UPI000682FAAC|nr:amino acid permease [Dysgonomonas sp. BGC7]MBD8390329.1 amino acid permease [Dysgonomonas sp. BGC7]
MLDKLFKKKDISVILNEPDSSTSGLKRSLSATNLITLGIGAIVGTGIFVITGQAAAMYAGPALTISFVISALGCVMAGLCYAEFAAMIPVSGGVYSYSYTTMGEVLAWFVGWILILEYLFACSSVAVGWSGYMLSLLDGWGINFPDQISGATFDHLKDGSWVWTGRMINFPAVFIVAIVSSFLIGGVKQSAFVNNIIVVIKVSVILLFIGFGLSYIDTSNLVPYIPENTGEFGHYGWSGIFRGAAVVFYAYLGFDALSTAAGEAKNPQKDMPKGILISLLICALLYISVTTVLTGIVNYKELNVNAPIALAIDRVGAGLAWLSPFIKLGAIAGLSSVILVMMLGQSRIYYSISKDGLLPKTFSKVHPKHGVPHNATIFACVITALIAGLFPLHVLSELVSIGTLVAFTIVCISIVVLRKTQPNLKRPFKTPWVPFIPLLGAAICIIQMLSLPWSTWSRLIGWSILGFIIYFTYGIKHSKLNNK